MRLEEITKIGQLPTRGFNLDDFDLEHAKQVGTAENIPIFEIHGGPKEPGLVLYALKTNDEYVSMILGKWGTFAGPAFFILRTYTNPTMRNRGLMTALYKALYTKLRFKLVSDVEQTPETVAVWKKLAMVLPVRAFDPETRKTIDLRNVSDEQLYHLDKDWRLVLECIWEYKADPKLPKQPGRVVEFSFPSINHIILDDYIIYTHPDTFGLYE